MKRIRLFLYLSILTFTGCGINLSPEAFQVETEDFVKYKIAFMMTYNTFLASAIDKTEIERWSEDDNISLDAFHKKVDDYYEKVGDSIYDYMDVFDDYVYKRFSLTNERDGFRYALQQISQKNNQWSKLAIRILQKYMIIKVAISYKEREFHDGTISWDFKELITGSTGVVSISSDNEWSCKMTSFGETLTNYSNFQ